MTSVEGRIAVEYYDTAPEIQAKKYAFKCHRQTVDGVDNVWPVNAVAFHPKFVYHFKPSGPNSNHAECDASRFQVQHLCFRRIGRYCLLVGSHGQEALKAVLKVRFPHCGQDLM